MTEWTFYIEPGPVGQQVKEAAFHAGNIRRALPKNQGLRMIETKPLKGGGRRVVYRPCLKANAKENGVSGIIEDMRVILGFRPTNPTINQ